MQHIHSLSLVHLDIKPENIFLSFPEQKLPSDLMEQEEEEAAEEEGKREEEPQLLYKIGMFIPQD